MSRPVVFTGTSIRPDEVANQYDVEWLPPVARGDIDALLERDEWPQAIGIIDGRFLQSLSISPKEVLRAIDRGIPTYGASSMGALRAVECVPFGMVGIGRIFEEYDSGRTDQEDEVAVTFDPEGLQPASEPLISWRLGLQDAVNRGDVSAELADRFLGLAKKAYFPDRTVRMVLFRADGALTDVEKETLQDLLGRPEANIKRLDGIQLLDRMMGDLKNNAGTQPKGVSHRALSTR
ncbi:TfuA-like protein [Streptomyces sp. NPDC059452]|uniref:TfuA-like protein n=1 Tax=Streptomyces sp. NPDC059452 TaxID=3346835 RepID=UPI0036B6B0DD